MKKFILNTILIAVMFSLNVDAQQVSSVPPEEIPSQNLLRYNGFLMNPTFSRIGVKNSYISLYAKSQWVQFEDSPRTYMLNYVSRVNNNSGLAFGVRQQNNGVLRYFGMDANYSYGVQLSEKTWLTAGFNMNFFESSIDRNSVAAMTDPLIANFEETTLVNLKPGINLTVGKFDLGFYAENLVSYDLRNNEQLGGFDLYSGHIMYTHPFGEDNFIRPMVRFRNNEFNEQSISGNLLVDWKKYGWLQAGYNDFYGASFGVGINVSPNVVFSYVAEQGISDQTSNLGLSHELSIIYQFRDVSDSVVYNDLFEQDTITDPLAQLEAQVTSEELIALVQSMDSLPSTDDKTKALLAEIQANAIQIEELNRLQAELYEKIKTSAVEDLKQRLVLQKHEEYKRRKENELQQKASTDLDALKARNLNNQIVAAAGTDDNDTYIKTEVAENDQSTQAYIISGTFRSKYDAQSYLDYLSPKSRSTQVLYNSKTGNYLVASQDLQDAGTGLQLLENDGNTELDKKWILETGDVSNLLVIEDAENTNDLPTNRPSSSIASNTNQYNNLSKLSEVKAQSNRKKPTIITSSIEDYESGSYIVSGTFRNKDNATNFMNSLVSKGFRNANLLYDSEKNLTYVAIGNAMSQEDALLGYYSDMNNAYKDDLIILSVESNKTLSSNVGQTNELQFVQNSSDNDPNSEEFEAVEYDTSRATPRIKVVDAVNLKSKKYYIVTNAFKNEIEAFNATKSLKRKGFNNASIVPVPSLDLNYVTLDSYLIQQDAIDAYYQTYNDTFTDELWILEYGELEDESVVDNQEQNVTAQVEFEETDVDKHIKLNGSSNKNDLSGHYPKTNLNKGFPIRPPVKFATKVLDDYEPGFYLIANVYFKHPDAQRFENQLLEKGFHNSQIIDNRANGYKYVSIDNYQSKVDAIAAYQGNLNDKYTGDLWLLEVKNSSDRNIVTTDDNEVKSSAFAKAASEQFQIPSTANEEINKKEAVAVKQSTNISKKDKKDPSIVVSKTLNISSSGLEQGYYIIANVFSKEHYRDKFLEKLRSEQFKPSFFTNPRNQWNYVYLANYKTLDKAREEYYSQLDGAYNDDLWILKIE